jgi:hypothetical protein
MGHVKEPKGVDFIIKSDPLTDKARSEISEFILEYKSKSIHKASKQKASRHKQQKAIPTK